jgi:D-cysteine desulfhydrase
VVSVYARDEKEIDEKKIGQLCDKTALLLHSLDPSFPRLECSDEDLDIRHDFVGRGYACPTEEGLKAVNQIEKSEGIRLDSTYTGKALACLLADAEKRYLRDKVVLFWNTYNSRDFSDAIATVDYHRLPQSFHRYFERDGQTPGQACA